jgi:hypothetical protein
VVVGEEAITTHLDVHEPVPGEAKAHRLGPSGRAADISRRNANVHRNRLHAEHNGRPRLR